ncbi:MAG: L7Ae/L30e/S12e/Gadd45 family ribosomal protein [bacterium]|jgi:ribosomal protein L7Ae-like RNA K-turn-binding protein
MKQKGISLLSFAQKAGKVVTGHFACEQALKRNKAYLLLLAVDAAPTTKKSFISLADQKGIPYYIWMKKEQFGMILGKPPRAVVAVIDQHFAKILRQSLQNTC